MLDHSPVWLLVVMAIALWALLMLVVAYNSRERLGASLNNFFAQRRHNRRMRNFRHYCKQDVALTRKVFAHAPARRHR